MKDKTMGYENPKQASVTKVQPSKEDVFTLGQAVFNFKHYPQLKGVEEGSDVSGSWKGKVASVDEEGATIGYSEHNIEMENSADKAVKRMMGKDNKPAPRSAMPDAEDEDM